MSKRAEVGYSNELVAREEYKKYVRENKGALVKYNHRIELLEDTGIDLDPCNVL